MSEVELVILRRIASWGRPLGLLDLRRSDLATVRRLLNKGLLYRLPNGYFALAPSGREFIWRESGRTGT